MCWIALDHTSVTRLITKRAKREDEIRQIGGSVWVTENLFCKTFKDGS